jgi:hypothetical protein
MSKGRCTIPMNHPMVLVKNSKRQNVQVKKIFKECKSVWNTKGDY